MYSTYSKYFCNARYANLEMYTCLEKFSCSLKLAVRIDLVDRTIIYKYCV